MVRSPGLPARVEAVSGGLRLAWASTPAPRVGMRLAVDVPAGFTWDDDWPDCRPYVCGQGFTLDFGGDRWRAMLVSAKASLDGSTRVEAEIVGRYPEDVAMPVSSSAATSS